LLYDKIRGKPLILSLYKLKNIIYTVANIEKFNYLINYCHTKNYINLKVDTGMNRQGLILDEYFSTLKILKNNKKIILHGVFSHLADINNKSLLNKQLKNWEFAQLYANKLFKNVLFHLGFTSSAKIVNTFKSDVFRL
jgi:alanine racemase